MEKIDKDIIKDEQKQFFDLIGNEKEDEIKNILKNEIKYEIWNYKNKENNNSTLIHVSVYKKNFHITQVLIEYVKKNSDEMKVKLFINEQNDLGITALHFASYRGDLNLINLLIKNGADVTLLTNNKLNIIHYCAQGNKPNSLMYFYLKFKEKDREEKKNLIQLIKNPDISGSTPLHWAAFSNSEDILIYLINLDIYKEKSERLEFINKKNSKGDTPFHISVINNSYRIAIKLLQNGASFDIKNDLGKTAYQLSVDKNINEISELIKSYQKCHLFKTPVKYTDKSIINIIIIISIQIISTLIMYCSIIPIALENKIFGKVLFCFYSSSLFLFFFIYILLLYINPGEIRAKKKLF